MSWLSNALGTSRPDAPTLPPAPTLQAPNLPQYPGMLPEQQQLLQQQQGYLQQGQGAIGGYSPLYGNIGNVAGNIGNVAGNYGNVYGNLGNIAGNLGSLANNFGGGAYNQQNQGVATQELTNYQNALLGQIPQNQMIEQQKARDWKQTIEQAGQQGIRLSGDSPESAVSDSTAGNQIIQDFTKRYGALEQNYNLGQQQLGQQSNIARLGIGINQLGAQTEAYGTQAGILGQQGQTLGNQVGALGVQAGTIGQQGEILNSQLGALGQLGNQATQLYQPYQQQQLGPYQQQTQQALSNADIANQNAMNQWQQQMQQIGLNYNNQLAGYQNRMGMISGGLQLGGMLAGGLATSGNPMGIMAGGQAGGAFGNMVTGGGAQAGGQQFNPGSYISAYRQQQQPNTGMGMNPAYGYNPYTNSYAQNQQQMQTRF